jgi:beta-glucanase (GH16 family)
VKVSESSSFLKCGAQRFCSTIVFSALSLILAGTAQQARADWTNVWSDEFNGTSVDLTKWTYDLTNGCPNCNWGNNEYEWYTSRTNNAYVTGGALHIRAQVENTNGYHYTSARLKTQGLYWKTRGWIEFRAKLPQGVGFWPALWMLGTNITSVGWPKCGEIDVMENKGTDAITVGGTIHYDSGGNDVYQTQSYNLPTPGDSVTNFHTYAVQWYTNSIVWLVDNVAVKTWTNWTSSVGPFPAPFDRPFFLIMNLAVGGSYVSNPSQASIDPYMPGEMQVDYVRVYDFISSTNPPATPTGLIAAPAGSQVALNWNLSTNATSYNVKRSLVSGGPYTTIATPTSTAYTDTSVANCATYYYVVSGTNTYGQSSNSVEASATLGSYSIAVNSGGGAAGTFLADTNFSGGTVATTASAITTTGLTNPAPQAVYQSERWGATTYTFGGLTAGTGYSVRLHFAEIYFSTANSRKFNVFINGTQVLTNFDVFAASGGQNRAIVKEYTFTPNGSGQIVISYAVGTADQPKSSGIEIILPAPSAPTGLLATDGDAQVTLNWGSVTGASAYNVKRATVSGGPYTPVTNGLTGTAFNNTGLVNGTTYYYVISTIKNGCESTNSTQVGATPQSAFSAWQVQYFGSPTNDNAAATTDPDGDGIINANEFLTGTDPTNSASQFGITAIIAEGSDIRVTWLTGPGKTNALQTTAGDFSGGYLSNFTDIFVVTNTSGPTTNYLDSGAATNAPSRYYRVRLVP